MKNLTAALALILFSMSTADAGLEGYVCTVVAFSRLTTDGSMTSDAKDPIVGKEFTVDRKSGKIVGRYIGSTGFDTQVVDGGSDKQSFKVFAKNPWGFLHVLYLEIQEYQKGPRKPFLLVDGSVVYSGTCQ